MNCSEKKDPASSIKFSEVSTLKKNQSKIENKIKIEQSLSEIRLEEVNSFNDPNITYLSMLKKDGGKNKENNITRDEEVLPTNLSTKERENTPKNKIQIINFKLNNDSKGQIEEGFNFTKTFKTVKTVNYQAHSQFSESSLINGEEKLKNLVRKSKKNSDTSRSKKSSSKHYIDNVNILFI